MSGLPDVRKVQSLVCEYVGTFFITLTIILSGARAPNGVDPYAYIAIGCTLGAMIYAFDHVSGAHFNPAVTVSCVITRKMRFTTALLYILMQTLGGVTGALVGFVIAGTTNVVPFAPGSSSPVASAFAVEALYSMALVLVMQNAAAEKNAREPNSYFGLAVSFTVLAGAKAVGPISGGCFNPAVGTGMDFASLLAGGSMSYIWVYWAGPILGAVAASYLKMYMNLPSHAEAEGLPLVVPLTECIGTFFLTLTAALTGEGLAVGAMLMAMVYMGDHVCGADYNPAVTLGVAVRMGVPLREYWKVIVTTLAQFAGAMLAALTARGVQGFITYPSPDGLHGIAGAVTFEALWTALLVYIVCAVMTPTHSEEDAAVEQERRGHSRSYQGLAIGFVVAGGIYCAGKYGGGSGGVFNPALGTALMGIDVAFDATKSAGNMWVYWVGPGLGAVLGSGLFTLLHYHRDPPLVPEEYVYEGVEASAYM